MGWNHQVDSRYGSAVWYLLYLKLGFLGYQIVVPRRCQNPDVLPKYPNIHSIYFLGRHPSNSQAWFWKTMIPLNVAILWLSMERSWFFEGAWSLGNSQTAVLPSSTGPGNEICIIFWDVHKCRHIFGICTIAQLLCQGLCWRRWRGCQSRTQCCWLYFITSGPKVPSSSQRSELVKMIGLMAFSLLWFYVCLFQVATVWKIKLGKWVAVPMVI